MGDKNRRAPGSYLCDCLANELLAYAVEGACRLIEDEIIGGRRGGLGR